MSAPTWTIAVEEAARWLKITPEAAWRLVRAGSLPAIASGGGKTWRVPVAALHQFMAAGAGTTVASAVEEDASDGAPASSSPGSPREHTPRTTRAGRE